MISTFTADHPVVQRFQWVLGVAHRDEEGPDSVHRGPEEVVPDADSGEDCYEEDEEDDDGGPPAQEAKDQGECDGSEDDRDQEERKSETEFPSRLRRLCLQLIEVNHWEEKRDETDENAAELSHSKHVSLWAGEVSAKNLENI